MSAPLVPKGKVQWTDENGFPLVGGTVQFCIPGTSTLKDTWEDAAQTTANPNPLTLDDRGEAVIFGTGTYRQIVYDAIGNLIYDVLTYCGLDATAVSFDNATLDQIFLSRLNRVVDSVDALRALSKATYTRAFATGYYLPHDGGGGAYQLDPGDTSSVDNGGTIIVASDGGRWKLQHYGSVSVMQFGAKFSDGSDSPFDSTSAFNRAFSAGLMVTAPPGIFVVSDVIENAAASGFRGAGMGATTIYQKTANLGIFSNTADFATYDGFTLDYSNAPTTGAVAIVSTGSNCLFSRFRVNKCDAGLIFQTGNNSTAEDFQIYGYATEGVTITGSGGNVLSNFLLDAVLDANSTVGGIYLNDFAGVTAIAGFVNNGKYGLRTATSTPGASTSPAFCKFDSVYFDSQVINPALIDHMYSSEFNSCWFSGGRSGAGSPGCILTNCDTLKFNLCDFVNCGSHGLYIAATCARIRVSQSNVQGNCITAPAATADGIFVEPNTQYWGIESCTFGGSIYPGGQQRFGINISAGCDHFLVIGNDLEGQLTAPLFDGTADDGSVDKTISSNPGYATHAMGDSAIVVGQGLVQIPHGLAGTPTAKDISITFGSAPGASGVTSAYVTAITSSVFQVVASAVVAGQPLEIGWSARIKGN